MEARGEDLTLQGTAAGWDPHEKAVTLYRPGLDRGPGPLGQLGPREMLLTAPTLPAAPAYLGGQERPPGPPAGSGSPPEASATGMGSSGFQIADLDEKALVIITFGLPLWAERWGKGVATPGLVPGVLLPALKAGPVYAPAATSMEASTCGLNFTDETTDSETASGWARATQTDKQGFQRSQGSESPAKRRRGGDLDSSCHRCHWQWHARPAWAAPLSWALELEIPLVPGAPCPALRSRLCLVSPRARRPPPCPLPAPPGLLQMQLILHYDETYREVKYGNMGLPDIDSKMLMGINVTPIAALLYTPVLIRFFGTKWMMFLAVGIYALFVSTNYWERYYTLVPSAVALGMAIVPLWASMGNYITRMAQKYYEYSHYKEQDEQGPQQRPPRGSHAPYLLVFQAIFYSFFHLSFACAQLPMIYFLNHYLYDLNHTLFNVQNCGTNSQGILLGFNKTVLRTLPRSRNLAPGGPPPPSPPGPQVLGLCGAAYRPTEEIDLRSVGWGNIFQLPFKHVRDFRLRHLVPFFIYSGFEVLFACTGLALGYGVCSVGLERLAYLLVAYSLGASASSALGLLGLWLPRPVPLVAGAGLHLLLTLSLFFWAPKPRTLQHIWILYTVAVLWGVGSALNKTGISTLLGILYEDKERQDFIFTIYHWWQAVAIFTVYLGSSLPMKAKLTVLLVTLVASAASYLWMEQKLRRGVVPRQPRIPRPQHKVRGYRYLEEDNSDESEAEGERGGCGGGGRGDCAEEEAPPAWPRPGPEPAVLYRRPCPYEQAQGGDGPEEQ
ncbi:PREDICTED: protein unc-93 homolog B1 [Bison bison bison]|uniref:Protein unc-93 homolog B1 n=1 Tax=Bison bison bison TaxID=43346 RepID=A0A6P3H282_BISBB|nr:PREDICTED: protein unc-93 homolog B1 [Bison bison bison]